MTQHDAVGGDRTSPAHATDPGQPAQALAPHDANTGDAAASAEAPATGDDRVDAALSRMSELDGLDVTEHAGVIEDVHRALQDTLAEEEG